MRIKEGQTCIGNMRNSLFVRWVCRARCAALAPPTRTQRHSRPCVSSSRGFSAWSYTDVHGNLVTVQAPVLLPPGQKSSNRVVAAAAQAKEREREPKPRPTKTSPARLTTWDLTWRVARRDEDVVGDGEQSKASDGGDGVLLEMPEGCCGNGCDDCILIPWYKQKGLM